MVASLGPCPVLPEGPSSLRVYCVPPGGPCADRLTFQGYRAQFFPQSKPSTEMFRTTHAMYWLTAAKVHTT